MPVTRDPDYPAEYAQLFQAFNQCADGHSTLCVLEAAANLLITAIGTHARAMGVDLSAARAAAADIGSNLADQVAEQWDRASQPGDVPVRIG